MPGFLMFDAYGTLFDVHSAVLRAGASLGPKAGDLSALWRTKQLEYSWTLTAMGQSAHADFWHLTKRALDFALERFDVREPTLRSALLDAYRTLDAFAEVPETLSQLKATGHQIAIFTNGTRGMVEDAIGAARLATLIDQVITVEETGLFKPAMSVYAHAVEAAGVASPGDITFVSSNRWDVAGAAAAGLRPIWVNRSGLPDEYPGLAPVRIVSDLRPISALTTHQ
jgi:2-haloacid dehalogenase